MNPTSITETALILKLEARTGRIHAIFTARVQDEEGHLDAGQPLFWNTDDLNLIKAFEGTIANEQERKPDIKPEPREVAQLWGLISKTHWCEAWSVLWNGSLRRRRWMEFKPLFVNEQWRAAILRELDRRAPGWAVEPQFLPWRELLIRSQKLNPMKLGRQRTILDAGCEGGVLHLREHEVLEWSDGTSGCVLEDAQMDDREGLFRSSIYRMEKNEVALCDMLEEWEQICSPIEYSEYADDIEGAVRLFMDEWRWWCLYPGEIAPDARELILELLEVRVPGWVDNSRRARNEMYSREAWLRVLLPEMSKIEEAEREARATHSRRQDLLGSVQRVLEEAGEPLAIGKITAILLANGDWQSRSATPKASVQARLAVDLKRRGGASVFFRSAPGCYGLRGPAARKTENTFSPHLRPDAPQSPDPRFLVGYDQYLAASRALDGATRSSMDRSELEEALKAHKRAAVSIYHLAHTKDGVEKADLFKEAESIAAKASQTLERIKTLQ